MPYPKDHWTLKTRYLEDPTLAIQVQTLRLEGPRSLGYIQLLSLSTSIWGAWKMWKKWPVKPRVTDLSPSHNSKKSPQPRGTKTYTHTHTHLILGKTFSLSWLKLISPRSERWFEEKSFLVVPWGFDDHGLEDAQQLQPTHLHRPSELPSYLVTSRANETSTTKCPTFTLKILVVQKKSREFLKECSMEYL